MPLELKVESGKELEEGGELKIESCVNILPVGQCVQMIYNFSIKKIVSFLYKLDQRAEKILVVA
jgi:hypothetical protein